MITYQASRLLSEGSCKYNEWCNWGLITVQVFSFFSRFIREVLKCTMISYWEIPGRFRRSSLGCQQHATSQRIWNKIKILPSSLDQSPNSFRLRSASTPGIDYLLMPLPTSSCQPSETNRLCHRSIPLPIHLSPDSVVVALPLDSDFNAVTEMPKEILVAILLKLVQQLPPQHRYHGRRIPPQPVPRSKENSFYPPYLHAYQNFRPSHLSYIDHGEPCFHNALANLPHLPPSSRRKQDQPDTTTGDIVVGWPWPPVTLPRKPLSYPTTQSRVFPRLPNSQQSQEWCRPLQPSRAKLLCPLPSISSEFDLGPTASLRRSSEFH